MNIIKLFFFVIVWFAAYSMQVNNEFGLYDILTHAPQPAKERISHYLRPNEWEMGIITTYFEKNKNKAPEIPENVYQAFDTLEYHHKMLFSRLILSQMSPRNNSSSNKKLYKRIERRLKEGINKTTHINVYVTQKKDLEEPSELETLFDLPDSAKLRLERLKKIENTFSESRKLETWAGLDQYSNQIQQELKEKYGIKPSIYKGRIQHSFVRPKNKVVDAFIVSVPFSLISPARDGYNKKLENHIEKIYNEEK